MLLQEHKHSSRARLFFQAGGIGKESAVVSSFAHYCQDLVDSSGQPTTFRNDQDFIPNITGTTVHVPGMSCMSQTLLGHPGSTGTTVQVSGMSWMSRTLLGHPGSTCTLTSLAKYLDDSC